MPARIFMLPLVAGLLLAYMASAETSLGQDTGSAAVDRPTQSWMLQCQGCHRPDGAGTGSATPPLTGHVAKFLKVEGGREYLVRVPGVSTAALDDEQLTELINWMLYRFNPEDIPPDFEPYTVEEVAPLRQRPLRTDAAQVRARLMAGM